MPRVGTCQGCEARYKIPDSVSATRAKCKKCGGIVEIPPADGAAPAAKPKASPRAAPKQAPAAAKRAPARKAPTKAAPAAAAAPAKRPATKGARAGTGSKRAATKGARAGAASKRSASKGAKSAKSAKSARSGRRAGRGARGKAEAGEKKSPVGLIVLIVVLLLVVVGGAGWGMGWFGGEDAPAEPTTSTDTSTDTTTDADGDESGADAGDETGTAGADPASTKDTGSDDAGSGDETAAAATDTPAPETKTTTKPPPKDPDEPLDPVIAFEALPMLEGTDPALFQEWSDAVTKVYVEGTSPRRERDLRKLLEDGDVVAQTPAYINALNGVDMSDPTSVMQSYRLVDHWQKRVARIPRFFFDGDVTKMDVIDINKRVKVITDPKDGWIAWWSGKYNDADAVETYRKKVAAAVAALEDDEG